VQYEEVDDAKRALEETNGTRLDGRTLTVERFNGTWQTITTYAPANNDPFAIIFPDESRTGYGIGVSGACQIAVAWIGPRLVIPGGVVPDYSPVWAAERIEKFPAVTRRGHFRGQRIERSGASLSAQFMPVTHTFAISDMADFRDHFNEGKAFVWASAPSVFLRDVAYCWADQGQTLGATIRAGGNLVNLSLAMEAYVER
jgi:RNA recognition motif-containing protein